MVKKDNLMAKKLLSEIGLSGLLLAAFALLGVLVLAVIYDQTEDKIKENQRQALLKQLTEIVAENRYDNALDQSAIRLPAETFDMKDGTTVYLARKQNQPVAAIFLVTTMKGYAGAITLLVGVNKDQTLSGVRVVSHKETPGLGDKIEIAKGNWITSFDGKSLSQPSQAHWAVKKDGGEFDQFTGATITPRAVVGMVKEVLDWSQLHFDELFIGKFETVPVE